MSILINVRGFLISDGQLLFHVQGELVSEFINKEGL